MYSLQGGRGVGCWKLAKWRSNNQRWDRGFPRTTSSQRHHRSVEDLLVQLLAAGVHKSGLVRDRRKPRHILHFSDAPEQLRRIDERDQLVRSWLHHSAHRSIRSRCLLGPILDLLRLRRHLHHRDGAHHTVGSHELTETSTMPHGGCAVRSRISRARSLPVLRTVRDRFRSRDIPADQFDEEDAKEKVQKTSFFTWYYQSSNIGGLLAGTFFVYIQENVSWGVGFGAALISVGVGFLCFLAGTPFYRHHPPGGNPLGRIGQVIVASTRKWRLNTPPLTSELYEVPEEMESVIQGSRKIRHTSEFRFLDKAAVKMDGDKSTANPWRLCTITQVEEVKILVRMVPIVITSAMFSTVYNQMSTLFIIQGSSMNLQMGSHFQIPPASLTVFELLSVITFVPVYDIIVVRFVSRLTKNPRGISELQRIGIGLFMSIFAMIVAALVEIERLKVAKRHDLLDNPEVPVPLSVFWLVPQYFIIGAAEVFAYVGIFEFFYGQSPDAIRGLGMGFAYLTIALGSFLGSGLLSIVTRVTTRNGDPGWIADNINRGHIDYFFWLLAIMSAVNFVLFLICARWYKTVQTWRPRIPSPPAAPEVPL
ncbi:hypothetical protein M758_7G081500 [Ceratodon purpureus]|nr:hypothetical protein M758_7G081500 [Ceratodon purpureus]